MKDIVARRLAPLLAIPMLLLPAGAAAQEEEEDLEGREEYERLRLYSGRSVNVAALMLDARRQAMALRGGIGVSWRELGPGSIDERFRRTRTAGRISAVAIHPRNPDIIYIGAAQGGVWRSDNGGQSWTPLTDGECSLAMGSIAIDPVNPDIIYAGTGEQTQLSSAQYGCGVLRSVDGGMTWEWDERQARVFLGSQGGARISRVLIDPSTAGSLDATTVLAATDFGLFRSTDSGRRWNRVLSGLASDLVMDPVDPSILYAAFQSEFLGRRLGRSGIYKSTDHGRTWTRASNGLRDSRLGRIKLAVAPSAPTVLYAGIVNYGEDRGLRGGLLLYRTDDGASTWRELEAEGSSCNNLCWYAMTLAVHPRDPDRLNFGGQSLSISEDGGQTFERRHPGDVYVDEHFMVFDTLSGSDVLYLSNDGGVYRSGDAGVSWTTLAGNLAVAQFYPGISLHPSDPFVALGGTQDQGTLRWSQAEMSWVKVYGSDGGSTAIDAEDPDIWYAEPFWWQGRFGGPRRNGRTTISGIDLDDRAVFLPPIVMDPIDSRRLYFGTTRLYRTDDSAESWRPVSEHLLGTLGARISAIAPSPSDPNTVYVGLERAGAAVTRDGGTTWSISGSGLPRRFIGDLAVHPEDPEQAYAVAGGFLSGHVFQTTNGGRTWRDRTGNLPDAPVGAVLYDPEDLGGIYVGTDLGVFHSSQGGGSWTLLDDGLPAIQVVDLAANPGTNRLVAATHGRGMYEIPIDVPLTARVRSYPVADTILAGRDSVHSGTVIVAPYGREDHRAAWSASVLDASWLTLSGASGQGRGRFTYEVTGSELAPGSHDAAITVTVAGLPNALVVPVTVYARAALGHMTLASREIRTAVAAGSTEPVQDSVAVTFEGPQASSVEWTATRLGYSEWLSLKDTAGVGDGFVSLTVDPTGLPIGTYADSVVVRAALATGSPAVFVTTLSVEAPLSVPALRDNFNMGVAGWSTLTTDSVPSGLSGFGAAEARWTATSQGSEWLVIERATGGLEDPLVLTRSSASLPPGVYEDIITIGVVGRPELTGVIVDRFEAVAPMSVKATAEHLLGLEQLDPGQEEFLDGFGNRDGTFNAGDVLRWLDHCASGVENPGCADPREPPPAPPGSTPSGPSDPSGVTPPGLPAPPESASQGSPASAGRVGWEARPDRSGSP